MEKKICKRNGCNNETIPDEDINICGGCFYEWSKSSMGIVDFRKTLKKKICERNGCNNEITPDDVSVCTECLREWDADAVHLTNFKKIPKKIICERNGCNNELTPGDVTICAECYREWSKCDTHLIYFKKTPKKKICKRNGCSNESISNEILSNNVVLCIECYYEWVKCGANFNDFINIPKSKPKESVKSLSSLKGMQNELDRFVKDRKWEKYHTEENLVKSMSIEVNNLLKIYQWGDDWPHKPNYPVEEKLANLLIYLYYYCEKVNIDPLTIIQKQIRKNKQKYKI